MVGGRRFLIDVSEGDLLAAVAGGELDALGELYRRHGAAVLAAARKVAGDAAAAEAATADAFVELWDQPSLANRAGVRSFLVGRVVARLAEEEPTAGH